ncbi:MAG: NAD(P)/FAD-dependent oxidoreductase, partial [Bdellovibrionota bacterium]
MITIVGAGLVGSLWAVLLRRKGIPVQVFERRSDPRKITAGAGRSINLVITSRGLYGLEKAGLLGEINKLAVPVFGRMIHSKAGELTYQAYGQSEDYNLSISRDLLNQYLISKAEDAGAKIFFDHTLEELDGENKTLNFKTPQGNFSAQYSVLFGTDGAGSRVRKQLTKLHPTDFKESTEWLEADYKELTLPLGRDGKPQLQTNALHIWPRGDHMMMALANKDGSFTVTLYLPKSSFSKLKTEDQVAKLFNEEFSDSIPLMKNYINEFMTHPQGTLGTVRTEQWVFDGSIALMGDAAHAIVPFFGQGMNSGFEDCTTLAELLDLHNDHPNWKSILKSYELIQKPNANAIAEMALENWVEMR